MYTVSQQLSRIGSLLKTGTPESGDSIIKIPNAVLEPIPFPHQFPSNANTTFSDSFSIVSQITRTNTAGVLQQPVCDLVPGVWRLSFVIDSEFNWLNANPIAQDNRLFLRQPTVLDDEIWSSAARVSRVIMTVGPLVFTLAQQTTLQLNQNGNGVGQTSTFSVTTHAARLL